MINAIRIVELNREWMLGCLNMEFISRVEKDNVTRWRIIFLFIIYYELLPATALNPACCLVSQNTIIAHV
jgi:hypothetical protein